MSNQEGARRIVEFREAGGIVSALVLTEEKGRLKCHGPKGTAFSIMPKRVLNSVPVAAGRPGGASADQMLEQYETEVRRTRATLDILTLWEIAEEHGSPMRLDELAELAFGGSGGVQRSAMLRSLIEDSLHFKQKKELWVPRTAKELDKIKAQRKAEKDKAAARELFVMRVKAALDAGEPVPDWPEHSGQFLSAIEDLALWGEQAERRKEASGLLADAGLCVSGPPAKAGFEFMVRFGLFAEDENILIRRYRLSERFPQPVLDAPLPSVEEVVGQQHRMDLTGLRTLTIDTEDTVEVDDALSVEFRESGPRIAVHIADPSEFVSPHGVVDAEALNRSTTHYLPESRLLMLPPEISMARASLGRGQVRPAVSFLFDFTPQGALCGSSIVESRIEVDATVSYDEADRLLEEGARGPEDWIPSALGELHRIASRLANARIQQGAVQIKSPDLQIRVSPDGTITTELIDSDTPSHLIVSELMVLTNKTAASFFRENGIPAIYRRQAPPDSFDTPTPAPGPYNPVLVHALRRQMKRTEIGLDPGPHWALAAPCYVQVSSPLRRYQDLALHRQLKSFLRDGRALLGPEELWSVAATTEEQERSARELERLSREYWLLHYLRRFEGKEVFATIIRTGARTSLVELEEYVYCLMIPRKDHHEEGDRLMLKIVSSDPRAPKLTVAPV